MEVCCYLLLVFRWSPSVVQVTLPTIRMFPSVVDLWVKLTRTEKDVSRSLLFIMGFGKKD